MIEFLYWLCVQFAELVALCVIVCAIILIYTVVRFAMEVEIEEKEI